MTRKRRLTTAVVGLLIFISFLVKEILFPEEASPWRAAGLYLYTVGIIVSIIYLFISYQRGKDA